MISFLCKLLFLLLLCYTYISFYYILKTNIYNTYSIFDEDLTKTNITNEIAFKLPFTFKASHLLDEYTYNKSLLLSDEKYYEKYLNEENEMNDCLLPYTKTFVTRTIYKIKSSNKPINVLYNESLRNYYVCKNGTFNTYLIHPKYKNNLKLWKPETIKSTCNKKIIDYIKSNSNIINVKMNQGDHLYLPNHWSIYIESTDSKNTSFEHIEIDTPLSNLCNMVINYVK